MEGAGRGININNQYYARRSSLLLPHQVSQKPDAFLPGAISRSPYISLSAKAKTLSQNLKPSLSHYKLTYNSEYTNNNHTKQDENLKQFTPSFILMLLIHL